MSMPQPESERFETDSLDDLEERVRRAIELVATLRAERDAALDERNAAKAAAAENRKLREELESLRAERKQVRTRIEKLLGQMERISGE